MFCFCLCASSFQDIGDDKIQLVQAMSGKETSCSNLDLSIPYLNFDQIVTTNIFWFTDLLNPGLGIRVYIKRNWV
jgi:hypothetical protein